MSKDLRAEAVGYEFVRTKTQLKPDKAFTLIELLVVIAVIAILLAILMPALQLVKEQARRSKCASNLRQHVYALTMYADENYGKLPPRERGPWLWDMDNEAVDYILQSGAVRATFYCPSNKQQKAHIDEYWDYYGGGYRVTGYFWMIDTTPARDWQPYGSGNKKWLTSIADDDAAGAELVTDVALSDESDYHPPQYPFGNFARNSGGMYDRYGVYDVTSHLRSESKCAGSNVGFTDCHVRWRHFEDMERRFPPDMYPTHWW